MVSSSILGSFTPQPQLPADPETMPVARYIKAKQDVMAKEASIMKDVRPAIAFVFAPVTHI